MAPVTKKKKKKDSQKHEVTQWPNAFLKRKCSPNHCPQRIAWLILLWPGYRTQVLTKWNTGSLDKSTDIATRGMKKTNSSFPFPSTLSHLLPQTLILNTPNTSFSPFNVSLLMSPNSPIL